MKLINLLTLIEKENIPPFIAKLEIDGDGINYDIDSIKYDRKNEKLIIRPKFD